MNGNHNNYFFDHCWIGRCCIDPAMDPVFYPANSTTPAGTSKTLRTVYDDALATNEETSINMLKYVAWVIGDMAGWDIASPMTHRFINGGR